MSEAVLVERQGNVAIARMNLPAKRNAVGRALYTALQKTFEALQADTSLRAVVFTGGENFCAGGDLDGFDDPPLDFRRGMDIGHRAIKAIAGGPLPVVAAVEGTAFGAGFSLAMASDFVVADEQTKFCAAFGRVGLVPDYGLLWSLPQRVGIGLARELLMLCDVIDGRQAHELKIVDRLCETGKVMETAMALAQRLAAAPPATIATTKAALSRFPLSLDQMLAWEADTQSLLLHTEDFAEGLKAFKEKRKPRFQGR